MTAVWIECPTHGFINQDGLVDLDAGSDVAFERSMATCPRGDGNVPIVDARYFVSPIGVLKIAATGDESAAQLTRLQQVHPEVQFTR